ncbi:citramalate synthase, partial [bacterium]|nr:citramalate synthase [bacterium]
MNLNPIQIYDTTLRDGSQGEGVSFSLQDKLNIARRLAESGIDFIEGGYPLSNEKDVAFFEQIRDYDLGKSQICAFGMTRRKSMKAEDDPGMQALVQAQTPCITLVGKTWDYHATEVLRVTLDENVDMIGESGEFLARHAQLIYDAEHFFDGFNANPDYAIKTLISAASAGAKWLVLCDTNGGTLPERIAEVTHKVVSELSDYDTSVGIHTHNDGELAVANSLAAVDAGALQVQGTINGIGERCGNADLISVISNLALKKEGYSVLGGKPLTHLTELSRYVYETANLQWKNGQAFVGQSAFAHKGGMHVHAINKSSKTYEHIDPALVGNERRILVSELSGRSNIVAI